MSLRRMLALAGRIIRQFLHDPRTLALLFIAPLVVLTLLYLILRQTSSTIVLVVAPQESAAELLARSVQASFAQHAGVRLLLLPSAQATSRLKQGNADGVLAITCPSIGTPSATCEPTFTLTLEGTNPATASQLRNVVTLVLSGVENQATSASGEVLAAPPLGVHYLYGGPDYTVTDALAPYLISLFSFFLIFLLTGVAEVRDPGPGCLRHGGPGWCISPTLGSTLLRKHEYW